MQADCLELRQSGEQAMLQQHGSIWHAAHAFLQAADLPELRHWMNQLLQHVKAHFAYEEALMEQLRFIDYREHVQSHGQLIGRLERLHQRLSGDTLDRMEMRAFLKHWTLAHLPVADARFSEFLNTNPMDGAFL